MGAMRTNGAIVAAAGIVWCVVAFNMPTSVEMPSNAYEAYTPKGQIFNLDLAERRRTHLMLSGLLALVGTVLFGFGSTRAEQTKEGTRPCPSCAELIKAEALKCRYCGIDVPSLSEQAASEALKREDADLQLMEKYKIRFENNKYLVGDISFDSLGSALRHAMG